MKESLSEIIKFLRQSKYSNEEQVRFSLVARILKMLNWDIWNPNLVQTEFKPNPQSDNKKVDIALFLREGGIPSIFIEIKSPDKLNNQRELLNAENQLKDYNADLTALFTVLTDGNQWRFYYSQEGGSFSQKRFKTINLLDDNIEDIESDFEIFLKKEVIQNGEAKRKAYSYLKLSRKQKIMEECLPDAKRRIEDDPLLNLVNALIEAVKEKNVTISIQEALNFIKKINNHIEVENQSNVSNTSPKKDSLSSVERINYGDNPPDLTHTKVEFGKIGNQQEKNWKKLITFSVKKLLINGYSKEDVMGLSKKIKLQAYDFGEAGFNPIEGTQYSMQGLNANDIGKALIEISNFTGDKLEIDFYWPNIDKAAFPNQKGRLEVN